MKVFFQFSQTRNIYRQVTSKTKLELKRTMQKQVEVQIIKCADYQICKIDDLRQ